MDVRPAPPLEQEKPDAPAPAAGMDVVPPANKPAAAPTEKAESMPAEMPPAPAPVAAKPPKQPGAGIGMAIMATVVIVFGLAVLATFAYIKTR